MPLGTQAASPEDITVTKKCLSVTVTRAFLYALDTMGTRTCSSQDNRNVLSSSFWGWRGTLTLYPLPTGTGSA